MELVEACDFFKVCKLADGYSPNTLEVYSWALDRLQRFLPDNVDISHITLNDLRQFMLYMKNDYEPNRPGGSTKPLSPSSLENIWKAVRSFFGWAEEELNIPRPDLRLVKPRNPPAEIDPLNHQEIQALIAACENTPTGIRNKAIVLMLLDTGLRVGELARLTLDNVQMNTGKVYVEPWGSGKKTKSRHVYLGRASIRALYRYKLNRGEEGELLFLTRHEKPMNRNSIRHMLYTLGDRAGVINVYPHRLRHTFAIQYLRNGGDVFTLQRLLGHSTLEMVRRYLQLADQDAAEAHRVASPVDRWKL